MASPDALHGLPLRETLVFLGAAAVLIPLGRRLKVSPVLGWLALGVLLGPQTAALVGQAFPALEPGWRLLTFEGGPGAGLLAELGVLFLLFAIGTELPLARVRAMGKLVFGLGSLQVAVSAALIGLVALPFGNTGPEALVIGLTLALSSTAVVMQLLAESGRTGSPAGRCAFSVLLAQDLAVVPILLLVALLGGEGEGPLWLTGLRAAAEAALAIALVLGLGRLALRPLLALVGSAGRRDLLMAAALLVLTACVAASAAAGLSPALGAFLAGMLIAESDWRHEIGFDLDPFRGLLLGLFFLTVGAGLDVAAALGAWAWLAVSVPALVALKAAVVAGLALAFGQSKAAAVEAGLLLGEAGEFAFVILALATASGVIDGPTAAFMQTLAGVTLLLTPGLAALGRRAGAWAARFDVGAGGARGPIAAGEGLALIAGGGRMGRAVAAMLRAEGLAVVAIDSDAGAVAQARARGLPAVLGDASRAETLALAGADRASVLVVTAGSPAARAGILRAAARRWPGLAQVVRCADVAEARALRRSDAGLAARRAVPEALEPALEIGREALGLLRPGEPGLAARAADDARERELRGEG